MQYREFGTCGFKVSALGFGTMRLPVGSDGNNNRFDDRINTPEAIRIIRHAIDQGVNYIDTAYGYHGGKSESVTGEALKDGYREKVILATKSPVWLIRKPEDFDKLLDEQLARLQTDCIDCYLLHCLTKDRWHNVILKMKILDRMEAAKKAGKIKHIGFSFHDEPEVFLEIIDGYDKWEFCQIQYNYMDIENQAGLKGLQHAASKGIAVIIMEPLLGGRLANPPKAITEAFKATGKDWTSADWALQWLWNQPEVSLVLSGMNNMQQVQENIDSASRSGTGSLSAEDLKAVDKAREIFNSRAAIPCTQCSYCMPCPHNVDIPGVFDLYNGSVMFDDPATSRDSYKYFFGADSKADKCRTCKACEKKCPQKIQISDWMPKVHKVLTGE